MALEAGTLFVTLEYARDLRDVQWFGRQDPYCMLSVGSSTLQSRTHDDGGRDPVWNQTFEYSIVNENEINVEVRDKEVTKDNVIGAGKASLARARCQGSDKLQVPIMNAKGKAHGYVQLCLKFEKHETQAERDAKAAAKEKAQAEAIASAVKAQMAAQAPPAHVQQMHMQMPMHAMQMPMQMQMPFQMQMPMQMGQMQGMQPTMAAAPMQMMGQLPMAAGYGTMPYMAQQAAPYGMAYR